MSPAARAAVAALVLATFLAIAGGASRAAAAGPAATGPAAAAGAAPDSLPWHLVTEGHFAATQFRVLAPYGSGEPMLLAFGREALGEGQSSVLLYNLAAPQYAGWQWNYPLHQGGFAGSGDLNADGVDELVFWRFDAERQRLRFHVERLRRAEGGVLFADTVLTCAEMAAGQVGAGPEQLPRAHGNGRILGPEGRLLIGLQSGFNWRESPRGLLIYDLQGQLLHRVALPNNTMAYRYADLDGDGRREVFMGSYASGNGATCPRGDDGHSYWHVLDLEGRDRLCVEAGGFATLALTQPLRPGTGSRPLVLASLMRSEADALRLYGAGGELLRQRPLPAGLSGPPLVADLNGDGAEECIAGLADGKLLIIDAALGERERHDFESAVQPLAAADLTGDGRPELLLRCGDRLFVYDRALRPLAAWAGSLSERFMDPLEQVQVWRGADGLPRLALSALQPGKVLALRLERAAPLAPAVSASLGAGQLALLFALFLLAGGALLWLLLRNRRLARRLAAHERERMAAEREVEATAAWRRLIDGLTEFSHRSRLGPAMAALIGAMDRLRAADSAEQRRELRQLAGELRTWLPELLELAPLARRLLGGEAQAEQLFANVAMLQEALGALATSEDPQGWLAEQGEAVKGVARDLSGATQMLLATARAQAMRPVLDELRDLLPALRRQVAATGALLELELSGALDLRCYSVKHGEFADALRGLLEIALSREAMGPPPAIRLHLAIGGDALHLRVDAPGRREGERSAARWEAFAAQQSMYYRARREGDSLQMRLPLVAQGETRARAAAAGGLLVALACLCLAAPGRAGEGGRYHFEALAPIAFDPGVGVELLCTDLEGKGGDNCVLLLRAEAARTSWLLVQRQRAGAPADSIPLDPGAAWALVGSWDLGADGSRELLLSAWRADSLELHALRLGPAGGGPAARWRCHARPLAAGTAAGEPSPRFTELLGLPDGRGFVAAYTAGGAGGRAGLVAFSAEGDERWAQEYPGRLDLEALGDPTGGGRQLLVLTQGADPAAGGAGAAGACLELDEQGRLLRRTECAPAGTRLRRALLRGADRSVGELRLLEPSPGTGGGLRLEVHPAGAAPLRLLESSWHCLGLAILDLDGDGREDLALATGNEDPAVGGLVALDADLEELGRLPLGQRPLHLLAGDFADGGPRQLLLLLPDALVLVDPGLQGILARRELPSCAVLDLQPLRLRYGGKLRDGVALLGRGQLQCFVVRPGVEARPRWLLILAALLLGLGVGAGGLLLWRWRPGFRPPSALSWEDEAPLLRQLLDLRLRSQGGEQLSALAEACRRRESGEERAGEAAAAALAALRPELLRLLRAWPSGLKPAARRTLAAALAPPRAESREPLGRAQLRALTQLPAALCGLEEQLARGLSADPLAAYEGALASCLRGRPPLEAAEIAVIGGRVPPVFFEPAQLRVVLENLVTNSLQSCERKSPGSGHRLRLELRPEGDLLALRLEDAGEGVRAGEEEANFLPGVSGTGSGLGLAIARKLVEESFGGRLYCVPGPSSLGGACFVAKLRLFSRLSGVARSAAL